MNKRRVFIIIYILLTVIKLFTARIDHVREEDPTIYFKFVPTIENTFLIGEEDSGYEEIHSRKYDWYKEKQYWEIFHTGGSYLLYGGYVILIYLWWISSAALICYGIYKLGKE